jgi:hypothetical protein
MRIPRSLQAALLVLLPFTLHAQSAIGDPPARVGRISSLAGTVSFQAAGSTDWSLATLNYTVTTGDRLFTSEGARAETEVGPFALRLADSTDLNIVNLTDHFMQLGLAEGTLRVSVYRVTQGDSLEVDTPNGALIIRSPGQYRVEIPLNGSATLVSVDEGTLEVSGPNFETTLHAGQAAELSGTGPIHFASVPRPRETGFDQWSADRDRRMEASSCSKYVSRDMPGCADLADHGRWEENPTYGPVWYPARVPVGWVPYRYGRWVWIEPWGWTWVGDEPWGFAPFHYGRWVVVSAVWVWVPGPIIVAPCYGPAFVAFVGGPRYGFGLSVGVHAWFPLGPREPFFPWYHHGDRYLRDVNRANVRNAADINVFIDARNAEHINYANRGRATTVVSTEAFRTGRPVGREIVAVRSEEIARAPIAYHPWVTPTSSAAEGGRLIARGPAAARPRMITAGTRPPELPVRETPARVTPREATPTPTEKPPLITRNAPPADRPRVEPRQSGAPAAGALNAGARPVSTPPAAIHQAGGRTLITRNAPPAQTPPYGARERAMRQDPGRPLEPQQMRNIQRGQPAGPRRDPEVPVHQSAPPKQSRPPATRKPPVEPEQVSRTLTK